MGTLGIRTNRIYVPAILALALIAFSGCQKTDSPAGNSAARAELDIRLSVDGATVGDVETGADAEGTKSVVTGSTLNESGRTFGIIACEHEDTPTEYRIYDADNANLYGNIQAWYGNYNSLGTKWWYSHQASSSARFSPLYFLTDNTAKHLDIYAYAPWKSGVTIQSGYQYSITSVAESDLPDLMYATYEDAGGNPTNTDIVIDNGPAVPVNIRFHHALSRIVFHFKLANAQNTGLDGQHALRLWQINLQRSSASATPLYTQGNMNLLTGDVTNAGLSQREQKVTYATNSDGSSDYDISRDDAWTEFNMLVHPAEYLQDGDFSFEFYFNGNSPSQATISKYDIRRLDLVHPDGTTFGFQPGCSYHFYFIIENYIHLQNVVVDTDWEPADETEIKI